MHKDQISRAAAELTVAPLDQGSALTARRHISTQPDSIEPSYTINLYLFCMQGLEIWNCISA